MSKYLFTTILFLLSLNIAYALPLCESDTPITQNCTLVTPSLTCGTYDYEIINTSSNNVVETGTLSPVYTNIYSFNFTQPKGFYLVKLCDGTTREIIRQEEKDNMFLGIIAILPMLLSIILLVGAATLNGQDHPVMKIFLFLASVIPFYASLNMAVVSLAKYYDFAEMIDLIGSTTYWITLLFVIIVVYFIIYAIYKMFEGMAKAKAERLNY
jgi:hypothetical protein